MSRLDDERGVLGFPLVRTILILAIIGLVLVETAAVLFARLQVQDIAETAANRGAADYKMGRNVERARQTAELVVFDKDDEATMRSFEVDAEGNVTVVVVKRASTLVIHRINAVKGFANARGTHTAEPPPA